MRRPREPEPGQTAKERRIKEKLDRLRAKSRVSVMIKARSDTDPDRRMWGDHWVKYELGREFVRLGLTLVEKDPDVILHLFGSPVKKPPLPKHTYNLVWLYSHPDLVTPHNLRQFDKIYCASQDFIPKLQTMGYSNLEVMIPSTSKTPITVPIKHDVIFLGNARSSRPDGRSVVGDLQRTSFDFKVWGKLWGDLIPKKYYGGRYWDYSELDNLYASARITMNDHHPDMAREGFVSNKVFDILASGGFAISDKNIGIERIFGQAVPQYESAEDLQALITFYLNNPSEREKRMMDGRKIALSNRYRDRAVQVARDFLPIHDRRFLSFPSEKGADEIKKILYIDLFRKENSNPYWLKAFKKRGTVHAFDIREPIDTLAPLIEAFRPDHIHLGGSVKNGVITPEFLARTKTDMGCTISVFHGDARDSAYHRDLSGVVDHIYVNNKTHIRQNRSRGLENFFYMPCGTDTEVFRPVKSEKIYDLLFVGNNNSRSRLNLLQKIHNRFDLWLAGKDWEETGFNVLPQAYGPDFSRLVGQAKILIGLIDDAWIHLEACFSNRVVNTLACGGFLVQRYTPGLESVFDNHEHLVWYQTEEELFSLIDRYLPDPVERERIGDQGRKQVSTDFTYDRAVSRILEDALSTRKGTSHTA
jgi:spore maturation protein CgeB